MNLISSIKNCCCPEEAARNNSKQVQKSKKLNPIALAVGAVALAVLLGTAVYLAVPTISITSAMLGAGAVVFGLVIAAKVLSMIIDCLKKDNHNNKKTKVKKVDPLPDANKQKEGTGGNEGNKPITPATGGSHDASNVTIKKTRD